MDTLLLRVKVKGQSILAVKKSTTHVIATLLHYHLLLSEYVVLAHVVQDVSFQYLQLRQT